MAIFGVSPAVNIQEVDLTTVVPAIAATPAGAVGTFTWGPIGLPTLVSSENEIVSIFGKPNNNTFADFFNAANYLQYGSALQLVRVETSAKNALSKYMFADYDASDYDQDFFNEEGFDKVLIKNEDDYDANYMNGSLDLTEFAGRYGGELANGIVISMVDANSWDTAALGTITVTPGVRTVVGVGTDFENEIKHGDILKDGTGRRIGVVASVTNATSLELVGFPLITIANTPFTIGWPYQDLFSGKPGTSDFAAAVGGSNDELHMVIVDAAGKITGNRDEILELYPFVSKAGDAKDSQGSSLYYANQLRRNSQWAYWLKHPNEGTNWGLVSTNQPFTGLSTYFLAVFAGGEDDDLPTDGEIINAYDLFRDTEAIDISLIPVGKASPVVAQYVIQNIAEFRKDCVAFVSPVRIADNTIIFGNNQDALDGILAYREALNLSSSYGFMDTGYKYQYDRYNDVFRWVPLSGDVAGLCARTDNIADPWFSPAGLNRGIIKNVAKLAVNFNRVQRDALYAKGVNSVVNFPAQGVVLFGDKTLLARPSAFDRINVRRLFIVLEKSIATASRTILFELNDTFTRQQFISFVEPFLRDVQSRRGVTSFKLVCDESNNTPQVIDNNEFRADIYLAPARSINYVNLKFVATRTGARFEELVG